MENGEFDKISDRLRSCFCQFVSTMFSQTTYIRKFQISKPGKKTSKNCLCATSLQLVKQEHESGTRVLRIATLTTNNPMTLHLFNGVDHRKRHICALIPSSVLKKIFYESLESAGVGCREKGRGVNLHTFHIPSLNTKQKFGDFLTVVVSGVIF